MERTVELGLLNELVGLSDARSAFLDETIAASPIERYTSKNRFEAESDRIFHRTPLPAAHTSELADTNTFKTLTLCGLPVLLTKDGDGTARAFLNVCRHRGSRPVQAGAGCGRMFSCPYHAWTFANDGTLRSVPHEARGFPDLDRSRYGLKTLPVVERLGLIWIVPDPASDAMDEAFFEPLDELIGWLGFEDHTVVAQTEIDCKANWKLLVEGGIEAYHFKIAHKSMIGPHFMNNLSSYQTFGPHIRSVLPRESLRNMAQKPPEDWTIREHANVFYTIFPSNQLVAMQDHVAWLSFRPKTADRTLALLTTLAPADQITDAKASHWTRNQDITVNTLTEDFTIGEGIQAGLQSGANEALTFGRFEGALDRFNALVEDALQRP